MAINPENPDLNLATLTAQDLIELIDAVIKVSPAATDSTKLQGIRHRALLKTMVRWIGAQLSTQETGNFPFDWTQPSARFNGYNNTETTFKPGFYKFMHPETPPTIALSANDALRQRGSSTAVVLSYSATPGTSPITTITVNGSAPETAATNGTVNATTLANTDTTFSATVTDEAGATGNASTSVRYRNRFFIFANTQDLSTLSAADLSAVLRSVSAPLADSRAQAQVINPVNAYAYVAYETAFGTDASLYVNGIMDTSFTPTTFSFTNSDGFVQSYILFAGENQLTGSYTISVA